MLPKPKPTREKWHSNCVASRSHHTPIAVRHNPIVEFSSHIQMRAARKSRAWRLGALILLLERQAFTNVPTSQFTHFVHELASSTSQSLLGAQPPNPCPSAFTNLFHTNVYLVFFFFQGSRYISTFYYLSALQSLLLLQPLSNSDQLTLIFIVHPSSNLSTGMRTAQLLS